MKLLEIKMGSGINRTLMDCSNANLTYLMKVNTLIPVGHTYTMEILDVSEVIKRTTILLLVPMSAKKGGKDKASYEQQVAMVLKSAAKQMSKYVAIVSSYFQSDINFKKIWIYKS